MDVETKIGLAMRPPTEELISEDELRQLFETKAKPVHYIGIEISGLLHVGSLLFNGYKINDLHQAGCETTVFLADWHGFINKKLEGSWEKMHQASYYYEEAFKFFCPKVKIIRGTELYAKTPDYWKNVIEFSQHVTLKRDARCLSIMGRTESEAQAVAQYFYPPMQAVDIKAMNVDIAHAGEKSAHAGARSVPRNGLEAPGVPAPPHHARTCRA